MELFRLLKYSGIHAPALSKSNRELPSARTVSFTLFPELKIPDRKWTLVAMQYGQIMAHDMALIAGLMQISEFDTKRNENNDKSYDNVLSGITKFPTS